MKKTEFRQELDALVRKYASESPELSKITNGIMEGLRAFDSMDGVHLSASVSRILDSLIKEELKKMHGEEVATIIRQQIQAQLKDSKALEEAFSESLREAIRNAARYI